MSAFHALDAARAAGVEVRLDGKDLVLAGASEPPADVLEMLRRHKFSIVALLQEHRPPPPSLQPIEPWDLDQWQAFFNEQIRNFEGHGLVRPAAEARAFNSCVAQWLFFKLVITQPGACPICGDPDRPNDPLLAIGMIGGRYWLHNGCVNAWCTARKAEAFADLAAIGISISEEAPP